MGRAAAEARWAALMALGYRYNFRLWHQHPRLKRFTVERYPKLKAGDLLPFTAPRIDPETWQPTSERRQFVITSNG